MHCNVGCHPYMVLSGRACIRMGYMRHDDCLGLDARDERVEALEWWSAVYE